MAKIKHKLKSNNNLYDAPSFVRVIAYIITGIVALMALLPLLLTVSISITEENILRTKGFSFIPEKIGFQGYEYLWNQRGTILQSYGVTFAVTILGTLIGLTIMTMFAYAISRKYFPERKFFVKVALVTMLFSGGTLPAYIINTKLLHLQDTIWALCIPGTISALNIFILRNFMVASVPDSIVESAKIDGASEYTCFSKIVLPMAVPAIATIALFLITALWSSWEKGILYITNRTDLITIQHFMMRIETNLELLATATAGFNATDLAEIEKGIPGTSVRMSLAIIVVAPILLVYPFVQRFFIQGIAIGSVKE